jgi:hypothetical protein
MTPDTYHQMPGWVTFLAYAIFGFGVVVISFVGAVSLLELIASMRRWWRRNRWI